MTVKNIKDTILGVLSIILGLYLVFSKSIISGASLMKNIHFLAKAETYIQFLGVLLIVFGAIIFICSISFRKAECLKVSNENFNLKKETILTACLLIVYIILLSKCGYFVATAPFLWMLTGIYRYKEEKDLPPEERTSWKRVIIEISLYSAIVMVGLYVIFTEILGVTFH